MADKPDHESAVEPSGSAAGDVVRLWDGRDYDREWLPRNYPEVVASAVDRTELSETMPFTAGSVFRRTFAWSIVLCNGFFGSILIIPVWLKDGVAGVAVALLALTALGAVVGVMQGAGYAAAMRRRRPSICLADGEVQITTGDVTAATFPFADVEWFVGRVSETTVIEKMWWPAMPAIVLAAPGGESEVRMAVGYTDDMRRLWTQLLVVSGKLRRTAWERSPWSLHRMLHVMTGIAATAVTTVALSLLAMYAISLAGLDPKLAKQLKLHGMLTAFVLVLCYMLALWPWRGLRRAPDRSPSPKSRRQQRSNWVRCSLLLVLIPVGFPLWLVMQQGGLNQLLLLVAGLWVIPMLGVAWDLARRSVNVEWQKTL